MKKFFQKVKYPLLGVAALVVVSLVWANQKTLTLSKGQAVSSATGTYANSQVDTVIWNRTDEVSAITFAGQWADSVSVDSIMCYRLINGVAKARAVGDSVILTPAVWHNVPNSANPTYANSFTFTLNPLADQYYFVVSYKTTLQGKTNNTVKYEVLKTNAK